MNGFSPTSLSVTRKPMVSSISRDVQQERSPYLNPVSVTRGTTLATLGGIMEVRDSTGGTVLFTIDPATGTVTIAGGVVVNQTVNIGTIFDSVLTGTLTNNGTLSLGVGTAGTIYNSLWSGGTVSGARFTSGSVLFSYFNQGTLDAPRVTNVSNYSVNIGSNTLPSSGDLEFQTFGTGPVICMNLGGTTFRWTPSGTI